MGFITRALDQRYKIILDDSCLLPTGDAIPVHLLDEIITSIFCLRYVYLFTFLSALMAVRKKRSLVIGRSTYPGSGSHQGHWTGDNHANWDDLALSISGTVHDFMPQRNPSILTWIAIIPLFR